MQILLIASLIAVLIVQAKRLKDRSAENTILRKQIASLKRQLVAHR